MRPASRRAPHRCARPSGSTASTSTRRCPPRRPTTRTSWFSRPRLPRQPRKPLGSPRSATSGHPCTGRPRRLPHRRRSDQTDRHRHRVLEPALGVARLSLARQRRATDRLHRPLAGRGHADQALALAGRSLAEAPPTTGVGHHPGRERPGPVGRDVGGSFRHIPACRSVTQRGCVIAYSTFPSPPPPLALFGRPGQGVSLQSGQTTRAGQRVLCVNPVTFSGTAGELEPYFLTATARPKGVTVTTPWVTFSGSVHGVLQDGRERDVVAGRRRVHTP